MIVETGWPVFSQTGKYGGGWVCLVFFNSIFCLMILSGFVTSYFFFFLLGFGILVF